MAVRFRHEGFAIDYWNNTATEIPSGSVLDLGGGKFGTVQVAIPPQKKGAVQIRGVVAVDKANSIDVMNVGQLVTLDPATNNATAAAGPHYVVLDSAATDTEVWVLLNNA